MRGRPLVNTKHTYYESVCANEAEQALRPWVILRSICHGTRTEDGTRILAILISVIETCRVRQQSPWIYLTEVIRQRRA